MQILMIVYNYMPRDIRVRKEALTLIDAGHEVDVICLHQKGQKKYEQFEGINYYRLILNSYRGSKLNYIYFYVIFFIKVFLMVNKLCFKKRYNVIHVHNMPDFLVFVGFIQKLFGSKIILDMHDPMPEIFMTKFGLSRSSLTLKLVYLQERISFKFANKIITTNKAFVDTFKERDLDVSKISIVMNSPITSIYTEANYKRIKDDWGKFIVMYHGTIVERNGLDEAVYVTQRLKKEIPELEFWIYGDGEFLNNLMEKIKSEALSSFIRYKGFVEVEEIARTIPTIDVGIIPNKLTPFTNLNFPVRIFEYIHYHKPVVVPRTQGVKDYFSEDEIFYFDPGDIEDLYKTIKNIYQYPDRNISIINKGYRIYEKHTWSMQSRALRNVYEDLIPKNRRVKP